MRRQAVRCVLWRWVAAVLLADNWDAPCAVSQSATSLCSPIAMEVATSSQAAAPIAPDLVKEGDTVIFDINGDKQGMLTVFKDK